MDQYDVEAVVDNRTRLRRAEDVQRSTIIIALAGMLITGGIAWGTAVAVVQQKVDRIEFTAHKAESDKRFLSDSIRASYLTETMADVKRTVNQTDSRLSRFICDKQPAYCQ